MSERQLDIFKENGIFWTSIKASDFVHKRENNSESQAHLDENRDHFNGKCLLLLKKLCAGERLLFCDEVIDHVNDTPEQKANKVGDLRRRVKDLKEAGIQVQCTWVRGAGIKEYWLLPEEIERVKKMHFNK